jgi:starvation-inducible outer membrane lipoprotein
MKKVLLISSLLVLSACTTVPDAEGRRWPALSAIPYDKDKPGAPSSVKSGVRVIQGTVNGRGVTVVIPH